MRINNKNALNIARFSNNVDEQLELIRVYTEDFGFNNDWPLLALVAEYGSDEARAKLVHCNFKENATTRTNEGLRKELTNGYALVRAKVAAHGTDAMRDILKNDPIEFVRNAANNPEVAKHELMPFTDGGSRIEVELIDNEKTGEFSVKSHGTVHVDMTKRTDLDEYQEKLLTHKRNSLIKKAKELGIKVKDQAKAKREDDAIQAQHNAIVSLIAEYQAGIEQLKQKWRKKVEEGLCYGLNSDVEITYMHRQRWALGELFYRNTWLSNWLERSYYYQEQLNKIRELEAEQSQNPNKDFSGITFYL